MPDIKEHIAYLSQEIGARPAGTEEEQQAALYITEQFQKEAGLPANIEDFNGVGDPHLPSMICCGAACILQDFTGSTGESAWGAPSHCRARWMRRLAAMRRRWWPGWFVPMESRRLLSMKFWPRGTGWPF